MNEKELLKLYNAVSVKYNIGTWDEFKSKMMTVEQRKSFYNAVTKKFNIGDYNSFESRLSNGNTNSITSNVQPQISANVNTGTKNVSSTFSCIVKNSFWGGRIKTTTDPDHIFYQLPGEQEYNFYGNGVFVYRDVPPNRTQTKGTWICDGDSDFVINAEDDSRFSSKLGKWEEHVSAVPVTDLDNQNPKQQNIGTEKRTGNYLKIGDKGELVGKLQNLLISKGFKNISKSGDVDRIFGTRTKNTVMDYQTKNGLKSDGIVGPNTWEKLTGSRVISESEFIKKIVYKNLKSLIK